ncbi:MAG: hypothetical protein WBP94_01450 [Rhodomicrobiaceae bacterium]
MLPQLLLFAAMVAASWFTVRWLREEVARVDRQIDRVQRILDRMRNGRMPRLEFDPATGFYHPVNVYA